MSSRPPDAADLSGSTAQRQRPSALCPQGEVKVNFCGKLATDGNPQVREAFLDMVGAWLTRLDERRDHEERLLPYLLSGLNDLVPRLAEKAAEWIEKLGEVFEEDRKDELKDKVRGRSQAMRRPHWCVVRCALTVIFRKADG